MANPLAKTYPADIPRISRKIVSPVGIRTLVYGLEELPDECTNVTCLWLLRPRFGTDEHMEPLAALALDAWNKRLTSTSSPSRKQGLIAASFDSRNNNTRSVDEVANEVFRKGNPNHAIDMYGSYHGTATDTSQLMTYLEPYIFPDTTTHKLTSHVILGVSLGGHAAWHLILHDPRIKTAAIVLGCADYTRLMQQRSMKSKIPDWKDSDPPGSRFLGSKTFPQSLMNIVGLTDPSALLMGRIVKPGSSEQDARDPSEQEKKEWAVPLLKKHLSGGKRIFNCAAGADKMVPYEVSKPFLDWFKRAIEPGKGWFADGGVEFQEKVYPGVGHDVTEEMMWDAINFVLDGVDEEVSADGRKGELGSGGNDWGVWPKI